MNIPLFIQSNTEPNPLVVGLTFITFSLIVFFLYRKSGGENYLMLFIGFLFFPIISHGYHMIKISNNRSSSRREIKNLLFDGNSFIDYELVLKGMINKSSSLYDQIKIHNEKVLEHQKGLDKLRELEEEKERNEEKKRYNSLVKIYGEKMVEKSYNEEVFINQPRELLIIAMGEPEDINESVTKDKVRETFFYNPHQTHLKTTKYNYSVTLENNVVVGYKDLD